MIITPAGWAKKAAIYSKNCNQGAAAREAALSFKHPTPGSTGQRDDQRDQHRHSTSGSDTHSHPQTPKAIHSHPQTPTAIHSHPQTPRHARPGSIATSVARQPEYWQPQGNPTFYSNIQHLTLAWTEKGHWVKTFGQGMMTTSQQVNNLTRRQSATLVVDVSQAIKLSHASTPNICWSGLAKIND